MLRVCNHATPAEELARSDDLQLLFSAISSPCPAYNNMWRKSAAEVLMTLSRHGLSPPVVQYIHGELHQIDRRLIANLFELNSPFVFKEYPLMHRFGIPRHTLAMKVP